MTADGTKRARRSRATLMTRSALEPAGARFYRCAATMRHPRIFRAVGCALLALALLAPASLHAKMSNWKDVQGASFKGEPTDLLGPFAIFRTGNGGGRRVLLRAFSPEDCRRIEAEIAARPARADRFAEARGYATGALVGGVQQVRNRKLEPADLATVPEPELLLVLSGSHNSAEGWFMTSNLQSFYHRARRVHPGLLEGVFLGARHDPFQHRNIATESGMPWLVAELHRQPAMGAINRYIAAREGTNLVIVTRQGVPLVVGKGDEAKDVQQFVDQACELLWQIDPANPAGWVDRLHYLNATRPHAYAQSTTGPLLVGDPLRADVLRKYGVRRVVARLDIGADGKVSPTILSGPDDLPADLVAPMAAVLGRAMVAPAIERGRPVPGTLDYRLEVPPADEGLDAERAWIGSTSFPTLIIPEWLVLRPIPVSEQDFDSSIIGETADGTIILSSVEVNTGRISRRAQMSAFNSNWFDEAGAGSVRPREGDRQKIDDETTLIWEKVRSVDGFVNMQTGLGRDYVVGYAWAEFDSPRETEALLGLGSDDGVKLWLNGELVHDKWMRRQSRVDDDIVPLRLKKGANRILIKIQNATIDWSFMYRLRLKPE